MGTVRLRNAVTKDTCRKGHEWGADNFYIQNGSRLCKICYKERKKSYRGTNKRDHEYRFYNKTTITPGCWFWNGTKTHDGYGQFRVNGILTMVHRYSYTKFVGPIPSDMQIDHLCRNRDCVNPEHLDIVSHQENMNRAKPFQPENIIYFKKKTP